MNEGDEYGFPALLERWVRSPLYFRQKPHLPGPFRQRPATHCQRVPPITTAVTSGAPHRDHLHISRIVSSVCAAVQHRMLRAATLATAAGEFDQHGAVCVPVRAVIP